MKKFIFIITSFLFTLTSFSQGISIKLPDSLSKKPVKAEPLKGRTLQAGAIKYYFIIASPGPIK